MKSIIYSFVLLLILSACTPSQQITSSWVNREALPKGPFKSIFILTITNNLNSKITIENEMAKLLTSRGRVVVKSSDIFTPVFKANTELTKEKMAQVIKDLGCDAVYTIAVLDVKTEEHFEPGTTYDPMSRGFYGSFYGYYGYYTPQVDEPGYYVTDNTYYIESNFFDLASDQLLWSIQSDAYNPSSLESWFHGYSKSILSQLKREGLIEK